MSDQPATRTMTLIAVKDQYASKFQPLTLVDNAETAKSIADLLGRTSAKVEIIAVPIWPEIRTEGD